MKKLILAAAAASCMSLSACATYNDQARRAATGAAIGAAGGAVAGALIPGVSTVEGAVVGGIAGAVLGAVVNGRQYYRDTRGYCYYVDQQGRPIYDYNTRC